MGLFDMFSGHKARLQLMETQRQQFELQRTLIEQEQAQAAQSKAQFDQQQALQQKLIDEETRKNKAAALDDAVVRLSGDFGFRSLLSGNKGGGGYGPRSMLNAA